ncbi:MFS transporter [Desulfotomaculum nigrificans]|uniref:MFS transporter n=1 Tax=Desulfotomaculum nigrificans TaxID=1565 RepID=UPI0001FAE708|nr:MFS transporter [Desulfotomaculum nigrificans]
MTDKRGLLPVRWRIAVLLFLSYVVWYMDRVNISIAGPVMMKDFGWSAAQFGMVQSAFFIGYAFTQVPGGWLADRFGGSKVIMFGTLWWSLFVFLTPLGATLGSMMIIRALMGVGEGVNAPTHTSLTARWMPRREAGRAMGFYYIGMPVGIMITMPLTVWIIENWGWKMAFYSFAFVGIIWCALWWWYGRDKPEQHPSITKEELDLIKSDQDPQEVMDQPTAWKTIFTNKSVWGLSISYFFHNYLWYLYMTWLPGYLAMGRGFSLVKTGIYAMLPYIVACFAMPLGGYLTDTWTKKYGPNIGRRLPIVIGMSGCGIFLVLAAYTPNAYVAVAYISTSIGFLTLNYGAFWSMPLNLSSKDGGVISGLMNTLGTVAGVFAPTITGFIITFYNNRFENALYFGAFLALVGVVVLWAICKVKPIEFKKPVNITGNKISV